MKCQEKKNEAQNKMHNKLPFNYNKKKEEEEELSPEEYPRHDNKGFLCEQGLRL